MINRCSVRRALLRIVAWTPTAGLYTRYRLFGLSTRASSKQTDLTKPTGSALRGVSTSNGCDSNSVRMLPTPEAEPDQEACQSQDSQCNDKEHPCNFARIGKETPIIGLLRLSGFSWWRCWGNCQSFDLASNCHYRYHGSRRP